MEYNYYRDNIRKETSGSYRYNQALVEHTLYEMEELKEASKRDSISISMLADQNSLLMSQVKLPRVVILHLLKS